MRFTDLPQFERDVLVGIAQIENLLRLALSDPRSVRAQGVTEAELRTRLFLRPAASSDQDPLHQALLRLESEGFVGRMKTPDGYDGWVRVGPLRGTA